MWRSYLESELYSMFLRDYNRSKLQDTAGLTASILYDNTNRGNAVDFWRGLHRVSDCSTPTWVMAV